MKKQNKKGNWVPKKKIRISNLDKRDQDVYQDIVEELLKNHNIPKDEITKQIKKRKEQIKNKKNMCSIWKINRRNIYHNLLGFRKGLKIKQVEIKLVKKNYENSFKICGYKKCSKVASLSEWKVSKLCQ